MEEASVPMKRRGDAHSSSAAASADASKSGQTQASPLAISAQGSKKIFSSHGSLASCSSSCSSVGSKRSSCRTSTASTCSGGSGSKKKNSSGSSISRSAVSGKGRNSFSSGGESTKRDSSKQSAETNRTGDVHNCKGSTIPHRSSDVGASSWSSHEETSNRADSSSGTQQGSVSRRNSSGSASGESLGDTSSRGDAEVSEANATPPALRTLAGRGGIRQSRSGKTGEQPPAAEAAAAGDTAMAEFHSRTQQQSASSSSSNAEAQEGASTTAGLTCEGARAQVQSTEERTPSAVADDGTALVENSGTHQAAHCFEKAEGGGCGSKLSGIRADRATGKSVLASMSTRDVPHIELLQHGKDEKGVVGHPQQQQHSHRLILPFLRGTARCSSSASPREKSGNSVGGARTTEVPASGSTHLHPSVWSGSCDAAAESTAAAPSRQGHNRGLMLPFDDGAAGGAKTAAAAAEDAEAEGGRSVRESARLAAESLVWKITKHRRPWSASHQPQSTQGGSELESDSKNHCDAHKGVRKESVSSHWLWREFFWHALHYSNKGVATCKQQERQRTATPARSTGDHMGFGEENSRDGSAEAGGETAALASEEKEASCGSGGLLPASHGASARSFAGITLHPLSYLEKSRHAESPSPADSGARAGRSTGRGHQLVPEAHNEGCHHGSNPDASVHSVATSLLHSAVHAVKSLPYRLRREWNYLLRARKNSAHINHTERVQRAAEVQQETPVAAFATAEGDGCAAPRSAIAGGAAAARGDAAAAAPSGSQSIVVSQLQRSVERLPSVAGRFHPKSQRERAQELQAILHMRQVLPTRETRVRLLQHVQSNIDKGRRDFERAAPLLSLRREQLLPCGSTFVVRCLQQDSAAAAHIHRKYLTAGRLIGGGSEAMVFAAIEISPAQLIPRFSPLGNLVEGGRAAVKEAPRFVAGNRPPSSLLHTAAGRATTGGRDADDAASNHASAAAASSSVAATKPRSHQRPAAAANAGGWDQPKEDVSEKRRSASAGTTRRVKEQQPQRYALDVKSTRGQASTMHSGERQEVALRSTAGASRSSDEPPAARCRGRREGSKDDAAQRQTQSSTSSSNTARQEWGACWALKWFLCEPFLLYSRSKAEQEGTVVDWLQMALWRLVPLNTINGDVMDQLGIAAPHWIGFIEGLPLVSPGDAHFSVLNRVAAIPLMLGDLLTVPPVGLTVGDRLYCIMRLIQMVANMHAMGVLHNDIKLENILVGTDGTLHIGDLGTVIPFTGRQTRFQRIGTDVYLDPQTAQSFLDYEHMFLFPQVQRPQHFQKKSNCGARENTQRENGTGTVEAATPQRGPEAGPEEAGYAAGRATPTEGAARGPGKASTTAADGGVEAGERGARRNAGANSERLGGASGRTQHLREAERGESEAIGERSRQTPQDASQRPYRVVYTPMRDAWAVGIVCYYIWCGGLLPYNLHRAFCGDLAGQELFRFLARLPSAQKGNRLVFPSGSCPGGEAQELFEVRRILQGLLEPDITLRRTPLEIVQESPLFSAYRTGYSK